MLLRSVGDAANSMLDELSLAGRGLEATQADHVEGWGWILIPRVRNPYE